LNISVSGDIADLEVLLPLVLLVADTDLKCGWLPFLGGRTLGLDEVDVVVVTFGGVINGGVGKDVMEFVGVTPFESG